MMSTRVAIIGGGAIGCSAAMNIKQLMPHAKVVVVERDPSYEMSSSARSASSIRQQFSSPVNIALSMYGLDFLRKEGVREAVPLAEVGYLYLASTADGLATLASNVKLQREMGADIHLLQDRSDIVKRFPWLETGDLTGAAFGASGEGWFDGFSLLQYLRGAAKTAGAEFIAGSVTGVTQKANLVTGVEYTTPQNAADALSKTIECDWVINAGGPWARHIGAMVDIPCPVSARRRVIHVVETCGEPAPRCPLVVDPSGLYFRGDGEKRFICGWSPSAAEGDADDLPLDTTQADCEHFNEYLWPALANRCPRTFQSLKVPRCWAGYYEVHPMDHNGIVGPHPTRLPNFLFANGFSGHGLQHSAGIGRGLAEWIRSQGTSYGPIDLTPLGYKRVLDNAPFLENNII